MAQEPNSADHLNSYIRMILWGLALFGASLYINGIADLVGWRYELIFKGAWFITLGSAVYLILAASLKYKRVHSTGIWFNENSDEYFAVILRKAMARTWQLTVLIFLGLEIATDTISSDLLKPNTLIYFAAGTNFLALVANFRALAGDDDTEDDAEDDEIENPA